MDKSDWATVANHVQVLTALAIGVILIIVAVSYIGDSFRRRR